VWPTVWKQRALIVYASSQKMRIVGTDARCATVAVIKPTSSPL
jgi:hypothetical protein